MQPSASFEYLREQIVGVDSTFTTPFGERLMVYCDYTASGRCLLFVENYLQSLQRTYANTHTEDDTTGRNMTQLLREAEASIKASVNAGPDGRIIAIGTGATGAINKLQQILGVYCPPATRACINGRTRRVHGRRAQNGVRSAPARASAGGIRRSVRASLERSVVARRARDSRGSSPRRRRRHRPRAPRSAAARPEVPVARAHRFVLGGIERHRHPHARARDRAAAASRTMRSRVSTTPRARRTCRST